MAEALVSSSLQNDIFLSWYVMRELGVIPEDFPSIPTDTRAESARSCSVGEIMREYEDVFGEDLTGGRCLRGTMKIHLKDGPISPKHVKYARRPPQARQEACKRYIEALVNSDVIVPVPEPAEWCSPAHFVSKGGGGK